MILPVRWHDVRGGMRVILSSGRVVHVCERIEAMPELAMLRNAHGRTAAIRVDPQAVVPVVFDTRDAVVASLRVRFPKVEFIRELSPYER